MVKEVTSHHKDHIKNKLNRASTNEGQLFADLCQQVAVRLVDNKISDNQKIITKLVNPAH